MSSLQAKHMLRDMETDLDRNATCQ